MGMTRDEIIEGFEKEIRRIHREPKEKMLGIFMTVDEAEDIVAMLKEQEAVEPTWSQGKACCGNCGQRLPRKRMDKEIKYCGCCGQAARWGGSSSEIPNS